MAQLWDRVAGGLLRQEEQHTEVLSLYNTLRVEFHRHTDRESMAKWIGDMLEERFSYLKGEVEKHTKKTQKVGATCHVQMNLCLVLLLTHMFNLNRLKKREI